MSQRLQDCTRALRFPDVSAPPSRASKLPSWPRRLNARVRDQQGPAAVPRRTREAEGAAHVHALRLHVHRHELQRRHGARGGAALALRPAKGGRRSQAGVGGRRRKGAGRNGCRPRDLSHQTAPLPTQHATKHSRCHTALFPSLLRTSTMRTTQHHPRTCTASRKRPKSRKAGLPSPHRPSRTM
jgi:hypothetical protein